LPEAKPKGLSVERKLDDFSVSRGELSQYKSRR